MKRTCRRFLRVQGALPWCQFFWKIFFSSLILGSTCRALRAFSLEVLGIVRIPRNDESGREDHLPRKERKTAAWKLISSSPGSFFPYHLPQKRKVISGNGLSSTVSVPRDVFTEMNEEGRLLFANRPRVSLFHFPRNSFNLLCSTRLPGNKKGLQT